MPAEHHGSRSRHYSEDLFYAALSAFRKQSRILDKVSDSLLLVPPTEIIKAIGPLIVAAHSSCESIILLSRHEKFADALVTARTVLTTAINICFICAKGQGAAERAMRHAIQKAYRDLDRHVAVNGMSLIMKWHGPIGELHKIVPGLESALKDFTTKGGKEKRTWTDENIEQQLGVVAKKYGDRLAGFLGFGLLTIYRHASEIAHGTLFSMWWKLGFTNPGEWPASSQDLDANVRDKAVLAIVTLNFCLYALIAVVSNEYKLAAFEGESDRVLQELLSVFRPKE